MNNRKQAGVRCALGLALVGALFTSYEAAATCYGSDSVPPGTTIYKEALPVEITKPGCPPVTPKMHNGTIVNEYALTMDEPAGPASLVCGEGGWTNDCIAWPQGDQITYTWKAKGGVTLDYVPSPYDWEVILNCTGTASGSGWVTVYAPGWGAPQTASSVAHCGNQ